MRQAKAARGQPLLLGGADSSRGRGAPGRYSLCPSLFWDRTPRPNSVLETAPQGVASEPLSWDLGFAIVVACQSIPDLACPRRRWVTEARVRCCLLEFLRRAPAVGSLPLSLPAPPLPWVCTDSPQTLLENHWRVFPLGFSFDFRVYIYISIKMIH